MKYGLVALGAAAAAGLWWHSRKKAPPISAPAPLAFTPSPMQFLQSAAPPKQVKKGSSPKKGATVDLKVVSEVEQQTQVVTVIGSCELPGGLEGLLVIDAYGEELCVASDS
jgi:hypothetical protein